MSDDTPTPDLPSFGWTVGELRRVIEMLPDDASVCLEFHNEHGTAAQYLAEEVRVEFYSAATPDLILSDGRP